MFHAQWDAGEEESVNEEEEDASSVDHGGGVGEGAAEFEDPE